MLGDRLSSHSFPVIQYDVCGSRYVAISVPHGHVTSEGFLIYRKRYSDSVSETSIGRPLNHNGHMIHDVRDVDASPASPPSEGVSVGTPPSVSVRQHTSRDTTSGTQPTGRHRVGGPAGHYRMRRRVCKNNPLLE